MDDKDLVTAARRGDQTAFGTLIDKYYKSVYRLAYQFTSCHHEADEICQETFLRAMKGIGKLKKGGSFKPWLFSISGNLLRSEHKRKHRFENYLTSAHYPEKQGRQEPLEKLARLEIKDAIREGLDQMPEQMRLVAIMVLMEGVNQKEAAVILNISEASVSRHLSAAKELLKTKLIKLNLRA